MALLDNALHGTVGHIGIAGTQQEQGGQDPAQAAVAVLEGMNLQEHDGEDADGNQRMQLPEPGGHGVPGDQLGHAPGRVEGTRGLEDEVDLLTVGVEGRDAVRGGLVATTVSLVIVGVAQQVAVQLLDMVLGRRDVRPGREDRLHDLGVTGHILLVARAEGLDLQVGQQALDLAIRQAAALDAGR